jgi:hypothetical protein
LLGRSSVVPREVMLRKLRCDRRRGPLTTSVMALPRVSPRGLLIVGSGAAVFAGASETAESVGIWLGLGIGFAATGQEVCEMR